MRVKDKPCCVGVWLLCVSFCCVAGSAQARVVGLPQVNSNAVGLELSEAVHLVVRDNRNVKSAYLSRVAQRFDLRVAQDKFVPNMDVYATATRQEMDAEGGTNGSTRAQTDSGGVTATITEKIPTGADFLFSWAGNYEDSDDTTRDHSWRVSVMQPLLKGGGWEVNMASVRLAELQDSRNICSLKSTLIQVVSETIQLYRSLLQNDRQVEISQLSLQRARDNVEQTKDLIHTGRLPANELVEAEADVASRELDLQHVLNTRDNARLRVINQLVMSDDVNLVPSESLRLPDVLLDYTNCLAAAFQHRPDWLSVLLDVEAAEITLVEAKNNRLWDLSFKADYKQYDEDDESGDGDGEWSAGLTLTAPLYGDLSRKQRVVQAQTALEQARLSRDNLRQQIELEVLDRLRDIQSREKQVALSIQARELSQRKLDVEQEKLKRGRSTTFQVVTYQNDLVSAQNDELVSIISYLNALNTLDQQLGTTLDTWQIELND